MTPREKLAQAFRKTVLEHIDRRPVSESPAEGTISLVDNGAVDWFGDRRAAATFKGGRWVRADGTNLPFEPTVWLSFRGGGQ